MTEGVSQPDQRKFPMADVAVLEVGGGADNLPANEVQLARGGDHVLVTRGGEVLRGRLINIEGGQGSAKENEPRTVSFQAGCGPPWKRSTFLRAISAKSARRS